MIPPAESALRTLQRFHQQRFTQLAVQCFGSASPNRHPQRCAAGVPADPGHITSAG
jgi:hypothetical protein